MLILASTATNVLALLRVPAIRHVGLVACAKVLAPFVAFVRGAVRLSHWNVFVSLAPHVQFLLQLYGSSNLQMLIDYFASVGLARTERMDH